MGRERVEWDKKWQSWHELKLSGGRMNKATKTVCTRKPSLEVVPTTLATAVSFRLAVICSFQFMRAFSRDVVPGLHNLTFTFSQSLITFDL